MASVRYFLLSILRCVFSVGLCIRSSLGDWVGRQNDLRFKSTSMIMKFNEFARVGFVSSNLELNNLVDRYMTK